MAGSLHADSGKQMTLAVFRQLVSEAIIDPETTQLRGVPWGTVNYFWKGCSERIDDGVGNDIRDGDPHLHVVWQEGDELRRSCVYSDGHRVPGTQPYQLREEMEGLARTVVLHRILSGELRSDSHRPLLQASVETGYGPISVSVPTVATEMILSYRSSSERKSDEMKTRGILDNYHRKYSVNTEADALRRLDEVAMRYESVMIRWHDQYDALAALDQLFIAV